MEFKDYLKILYRRRLWVVGTLLLSLSLFGFYYTYEIQTYQAAGKILLRRSDPVLSIMGGITYSPKVLSYRTQMSVASSQPVCERAAKLLANRATPGEIKGALSLEKEGDTEIVVIRSTYPDPDLAVGIVNAVIDAFAAYDDEEVKKGANAAISFLTQQMEEINKRELPEIESRLKEFRQTRRIYDLSEQIKLDLKRLAEAEALDAEIELQIGDIDTEIDLTRRQIREFIASCEKVVSEKESHVPRQDLLKGLVGPGEIGEEERRTDLLATLKERVLGQGEDAPAGKRVARVEQELALARLDRRSMLANFTETHPEVLAKDRHIAGLEEMLAAALAEDTVERALRRRFSVYDQLLARQAQRLALVDKRKRSQEQAARLRERLGAISDDEIQYLGLSRQFSATKERLAAVASKRADLELEKRRLEGNVTVYEHAPAGSSVAVPKSSTRSLPLVVMMSVVAAIGMAYLTDIMDTTLRTDYHISRFLNLPALGVIPFVDERESRLLVSQPLRTSLMEDFSRLATFFPSQYEESGAKVFMVVSFNEEEGKSTTASNLGVAFARNGYTVVIIDGDMRKPKLHDFFGVPIHPGLSSLLDGSLEAAEEARRIGEGKPGAETVESVLAQTLMRPEAWKGDGLYVIPSGTIPENPAGLLRSERSLRFLDEVREAADVILIDAPPLIGAADALILAPWVDGVLFLVEAGATTKEQATQAKKMIENAGGRIVGCILNKARETASASYYYYSRGYGYNRRRYGSYGGYGS